MTSRAPLWAAAFLCLVGVNPAEAQSAGAVVTGYARAAATNQPVLGTIISLQSGAGEIIQQATIEGGGQFQFQNLRRQVYYVTAKAPGYREATQRVDLN